MKLVGMRGNNTERPDDDGLVCLEPRKTQEDPGMIVELDFIWRNKFLKGFQPRVNQ